MQRAAESSYQPKQSTIIYKRPPLIRIREDERNEIALPAGVYRGRGGALAGP